MRSANEFRLAARESLKGRWKIAILAGIIASMLGAARSAAPDINFNFETSTVTVNDISLNVSRYFADMTPTTLYLIISIAIIAVLSSIALTCISSIISVGYAKFNLDLADGKEELRIRTLFGFFGSWHSIVWAHILQCLYIILWSLLFVIPGIMASYSYAMTPYILSEHPELTAQEAIAISKNMMRGNRWRLFGLEISFFGWILLTILTLGIGEFWLIPYTNAARAHFYREVSGDYSANTEA